MHATHVFLGPSLCYKTAVTLLPEAHYHPPIKCGDIIRLLRLEPKKIIIIDGLYEIVPAVWHKEILLAMELDVEVWGASSMGALRAAELHQLGMHGFGCVFEDFKTGVFCDDDEVAVLHRGVEDDFSPMNDAMINIRYTCDAALQQEVISLKVHDQLIAFCKEQFYPYRSLNKALKTLNKDCAKESKAMTQWLFKHGMLDMKQQDAINVLTFHHQRPLIGKKLFKESTPITVFLKELTYHTNLLPFEQQADWLPEVEKQLQILHRDSLNHYIIVAEVAHFTRRLCSFMTDSNRSINTDMLLSYIKQNHLYNPESEFQSYKAHPVCSDAYAVMCQSICMEHVSAEKINQYLPIIAHYYDLDHNTAMHCEKILRALTVLIFSIEIQLKKFDVQISEKSLMDQLNKMMQRRNYSNDQFKAWINPSHLDESQFILFVSIYSKVTGSYSHEDRAGQIYFKWLYAAYNVYLEQLCDVNGGLF